jgi:hypothetical protein
MSEYDLIPELGDLVTFKSDVHTTTTGRIIFRNGESIRIRPSSSSSTAIEFPLDPETGLFQDSLGVSEIIIHEKRRFPHFAKQLSTVPGEILEFFNSDGTKAQDPGIVFEVIATDTEDAIKMENGAVYNFQFLGPPPPIGVMRPRGPPEPAVDDSEYEPVSESIEEFPDIPIDYSMLPAPLVEEVPSAEQTFDDTIQREDMFTHMLRDIPAKRQRDPKVMQNLYRATDLLLALKNSVVTRDAGGAVNPQAPSRSYTANTIQEALEKQPNGAPIPALLPVVAVKKVLYTDTTDTPVYTDVEFRNDTTSLLDVARVDQTFAEARKGTNAFAVYLSKVLHTIDAFTPAVDGDSKIRIDQDVLRSQIPPEPVEGFPTVPPTFTKKGDANELTKDYLGTIEDRSARLLAASYFRNPNTDSLVQITPADSAETVGHVLLSKSMARYRAPIRSSVLLWDIEASEQSRGKRTILYKTLSERWADQVVLVAGETTPILNPLRTRIRPSVSYMNKENVETLDSMGLRNLEITDKLFEVLVNSVDIGQSRWTKAYTKLQERATTALQAPTVPAVPATVAVGSALLNSLDNPSLSAAFAQIKERETSLANYDLVIANDLLKEANATLGPLWYAVAGSASADETTLVERTYKAEAGRAQRNTGVRRGLSKEFTALPSLNACVHVHELEQVRGVRDDSARMLLFEKFVKKYQAGQQGNWILCSTCGKDLVCKHEIVLLNEFLHPGRSDALHKSLLLDYAGPVFEGAYICKNCGQKIQEIEYDTHLEFDDEGRPLMGRSVAEADAEEKAEFDSVVIAEEVAEKTPFKSAELPLYYNFRTVFERCGLTMPMEAYTRVVRAAQDFLSTNVPPRAAYEARAAKAKSPQPPYEAFYANIQIGIVGALVILELQTSSIPVPIPATGCKFSRDGFPLDGDVITAAGTGAVDYVTCVITGINRNDAPWNITPWSGLTGKSRLAAIESIVKTALHNILCLPPVPKAPVPPPLTTVTDSYRTLLAEAHVRKHALATGTSGAALISNSDKLPSSFRPLPHIHTPSIAAERPVTNVKQFQHNVASSDVSKIGPVVYQRDYQLSQLRVGQLHDSAKESGVIIPSSVRSDSVCCFSRLGHVAQHGMSSDSKDSAMMAELDLVAEAARTLQGRDPARSSTGTHLFVPWSAPLEKPVLASSDTTTYYKLFLKHCFRGRNYGLVHEFGPDYACRQCHFQYPEELTYLTASELSESNGKKQEALMDQMNKQRNEIALGAFATLGIEINEATFRNLEMEIRQRKTFVVPEPIVSAPFMDVLASLGQTLNALLPVAQSDWESLMAGITEIKTGRIKEEVQRATKLTQFAKHYNSRQQQLKETLLTAMGPHGIHSVESALDSLKVITEEAVGNVAVRNLADIFVVGASQIAHGFKNTTPRSKKWFPTISRNHAELLDKIWKKAATVTTSTLSEMQKLEEDVQAVVKSVCEQFAPWFGAWLTVWRKEIRPDSDLTLGEYTFVLRWSVFSGLVALLTPSSPLYSGSGASVPMQHEAARFLCKWVLNGLTAATSDVKTYQLTPMQISEAIHVRAELEKAAFINKFDKLDGELRKVELMKKKLKIGDWAVGTLKNLFSYDADFFEFERAQRATMGVPEFAGDITGVAEGAEHIADPGVGMDDTSNHRAQEDEDE